VSLFMTAGVDDVAVKPIDVAALVASIGLQPRA
jgi:hypothetical protein